MKKLPAILMASAMTIGSVVPAFAVTPPLNIKGFTIVWNTIKGKEGQKRGKRL